MVLPLALTVHGLLHPGPLKYTVLLDELKFEPNNVIVNACPLMGGFGLVLMLVSTGADAGAECERVECPNPRPRRFIQ